MKPALLLAGLAATHALWAGPPDASPGPLPTSHFAPTRTDPPAARPIEGELRFSDAADTLVTGALALHVDSFGIASDPALDLTRLPSFRIHWISDNDDAIPVERLPQAGEHPLWEFIAGPGRVWTPVDQPGIVRLGFPFTLKESLQNCVHDGLATVDLPAGGGRAEMTWQVSAQTCAYLKFELAGRAQVEWLPGTVPGRQNVVNAYREEVGRRLPVRPVTALAEHWPEVDPAALAPASRDDLTVFGLVIDGVHYRGGCDTAHGPHPYCDARVLPSYSTAKSLFAGLGYLHLLRRFPELATATVAQWVPGCRLDDGRWDDVTLEQLLDMSSGNFASRLPQVDEFDEASSTLFITPDNATRTRIACTAWPRQAEPGTVAVYHSSDHYLLGVALARFLVARNGPAADLFNDVLFDRILSTLEPGPMLAYTERTHDQDRQPFVAYGLLYQSDDVARLGQALPALLGDQNIFPENTYDEVLFRNIKPSLEWPGGERYRLGWWGFDAGPVLGCKSPAWIPFMTGYGGIIWALLPNGMTYYRFTDGEHQPWRDAIRQAHKIRPICH